MSATDPVSLWCDVVEDMGIVRITKHSLMPLLTYGPSTVGQIHGHKMAVAENVLHVRHLVPSLRTHTPRRLST